VKNGISGAEDADNLKSCLDQTRNILGIWNILDGHQEKPQFMHPCLIKRLALLFFAAGMRFSYRVNYDGNTRKTTKKNAHE
jgi:hypothetical protein